MVKYKYMNNTKNITTILLTLLFAIIIFAFWFFNQKSKEEYTSIPKIEEVKLEEENFVGAYSKIEGDSRVVKLANAYIEETLESFKKSADEEVPAILLEDRNSFSANYSIFIESEYLKGESTESIVVNTYVYTGGANGTAIYKTFTLDNSGRELELEDVILEEKQNDFVAFVKKTLLDWRVDDTDHVLVFEDVVNELKFEDIKHFAFDGQDLNIYFSEYDIAPGAVGSPMFTLKYSDISNFLK